MRSLYRSLDKKTTNNRKKGVKNVALMLPNISSGPVSQTADGTTRSKKIIKTEQYRKKVSS
jgi:hypothetical protein